MSVKHVDFKRVGRGLNLCFLRKLSRVYGGFKFMVGV